MFSMKKGNPLVKTKQKLTSLLNSSTTARRSACAAGVRGPPGLHLGLGGLPSKLHL